MKDTSIVLAALVAFLVFPAAAQELPALVAKVYPGAVAGNTKAGKSIPCGYGEDHHDAYCFLTKDPVEKVREFYAREGVALDRITVGKDQNSLGDGVQDLEEAVRLQLIRTEIGLLYAGPVEFRKTIGSADEPSYFNSVIVMSGKTRDKFPAAAKADAFEDTVFAVFALKPETAAFFNMGIELGVDPARLVPIANKHLALLGSFFKKEGRATMVDKRLEEAKAKRNAELGTAGNYEKFQTQDNKAKAIDALLGELEKDAYPTLIMIQRPRKDGVTRNAAVVQKEWHAVVQRPKGK